MSVGRIDPLAKSDLRVMASFLQQGRHGNHLSRLLLALSALWLIQMHQGIGPAAIATYLFLILGIGAGLLQCYCALRVSLDAVLLRTFDSEVDATQAAMVLDSSLHRLALVSGPDGRDWSERWRGMRRWWRCQHSLLAFQVVAFALALWPVLEATPCH